MARLMGFDFMLLSYNLLASAAVCTVATQCVDNISRGLLCIYLFLFGDWVKQKLSVCVCVVLSPV